MKSNKLKKLRTTYKFQQFFTIGWQFLEFKCAYYLFGWFLWWMIWWVNAWDSTVGYHFIFFTFWIREAVYKSRRRCGCLVATIGRQTGPLVNCYLRRTIFAYIYCQIVEIDRLNCVVQSTKKIGAFRLRCYVAGRLLVHIPTEYIVGIFHIAQAIFFTFFAWNLRQLVFTAYSGWFSFQESFDCVLCIFIIFVFQGLGIWLW